MLRRPVESALTAAVGVKHGVFAKMAVADGHGEGVGDQAGAHVVGELPADDHPAGQVEHRRQIQPAFTGA